MKSLFYKILYFSTLVFTTCIIVEILLRQIPNDYKEGKKFLDKFSDSLEILVLGGSHGIHAYDTLYSIHKNSFNAANSAQSLDYDYEILKKYIGRWTNLKYILLPVSYGSLFLKIETSEEPWRAKDYIIYYDINISDNPRYHIEIMNGILGEQFIRLFKFYCKKNIKKENPCNNYIDTLMLRTTGVEDVKRHTPSEGPKYLNEMKSKLYSIVNFAKDNDIKLIMFTTPVYKSYFENMQKSQLDTTLSIIKSLVQENENCFYYNYINDKSFTEEDFRDGDHLNKNGTRKFTLKLDSLICNLEPDMRFNSNIVSIK